MGAAATVDDGTLERMRSGAKDLVVRARAGDQCAIAMIVRVREQAPHSRRAALAYDLLRDYVERNPVGRLANFAGQILERPMPTLWHAVMRGTWPEAGRVVVRCVERLPTDVERYARAACVVADGMDVTPAVVVRGVLPHLRGDAVLLDGKPATIDEAKRAGKRTASRWVAEYGRGGDLRVASNGMDVGFRRGSEVLSSLEMFCVAFNRATDCAGVQEYAAPFARSQRQPIRVGYVLGLARAIQGVARKEGPIADLSDLAAWELGEEDQSA